MEAIENKTLTRAQYQFFLQKGITYDRYKREMTENLAFNTDPRQREYIDLNRHRMSRVEKTYKIGEVLLQQVKSLQSKIYWLVLTEHWCGDAAQTLPVLQKVAELSNGMIDLRLVYRDENPDLMDAYLTGESRSIPKLIQLDMHYHVSGFWGPRPNVAQRLVKELKANPQTASSYGTELHKWYARDKQRALEADLTKLLNRASIVCVNCF
jgi:thioredoxin-like negative regulator of GroEL